MPRPSSRDDPRDEARPQRGVGSRGDENLSLHRRPAIEGVVFDMDGTLIKTERLKARAYARAAVQLGPEAVEKGEVLQAYKDVVGQSRRAVATTLMERFGLEDPARQYMEEFGVTRPWQAYTQLRLRIQEDFFADPDVLRRHRWEHTDQLLETVQERGCTLGLATMSYCRDAARILDVLGLADHFEFVATRDDVSRPKPDPEIYHLVFYELELAPERTLVIEDSPAGVEAAVRSGARVVAFGTPFSREHHLESDQVPDDRVATTPDELCSLVSREMSVET